jgi:isopentenyldiphosphate isomerase
MGFACELREVGALMYRSAFINGLVEHEFLRVYAGAFNDSFAPHPAEVDAWHWIDMRELAESIEARPEAFTAWFRLIVERTGATGVFGWDVALPRQCPQRSTSGSSLRATLSSPSRTAGCIGASG